ncbi:hexose transporter hxt5 [Coniosporium apollinis]|uniref:Hexose transporter hxt5 n=1 Tax=Coniosporium apollinis TaxID=61459 RepID=A0ABQ9NZL8_9PEZI|nr:hexose transporter hxt5 [Coniosporium apollinis]
MADHERIEVGKSANGSPHDVDKALVDNHMPVITFRAFIMCALVSMGGIMFGYDCGSIAGYLQMPDFQSRFANRTPSGGYEWPPALSGILVGGWPIGACIGALAAAKPADTYGRKWCISGWAGVHVVGTLIQITAMSSVGQMIAGRVICGIGVGALSVLVPMYMGESSPTLIRGALVSAYQLFVTLGILLSNLINFGTSNVSGSAQWRITAGIGFLWSGTLAFGMIFMKESPRYAYRKGRAEEARQTMAVLHGVPPNHVVIESQTHELGLALAEEERAGKASFFETFKLPRMRYRVFLGVFLHAGQQFTGANYFFYYGTTVFRATGISNSFVTQIILGAVNCIMTFPGLWMVEHLGRRVCLVGGALWMGMCFLVFSSLGAFRLNPDTATSVGGAMIAFACLFISGFASTWGPLVWGVSSELFPTPVRANCSSLVTAVNWTCNFLIGFFTPYITNAVGFSYGYVFAGCCIVEAVVVYSCLIESHDRTLEEIDAMYVHHVNPITSAKWTPPPHLAEEIHGPEGPPPPPEGGRRKSLSAVEVATGATPFRLYSMAPTRRESHTMAGRTRAPSGLPKSGLPGIPDSV